jgi:phospholipase/carboxylesterase
MAVGGGAVVLALLAGACDGRRREPAPPGVPPAAAPVVPGAGAPVVAAPSASPPGPEELPVSAGLRYFELITGGASRTDSLALVVAIHGLGGDARAFSALLADFPAPARVIFVQAPDPYEGGWSWFPFRARDQDPTALARGIEQAADRVAATVRDLRSSLPTVGRPIVTGFSQGGMISFALATRHPDLIQEAIPVGGWLPPPAWPSPAGGSRRPPITALHGTEDPAVRHAPTAEAVAALVARGFPASLESFPGVRHAIPPEMRARLHALLARAVEHAPDLSR